MTQERAAPKQEAVRGGPRSALLDSLHLVTLSGFAVAQPLFDVLGREATFFVAHRSRTADLVLLALALALLVPAPLVVAELLVGAVSRRARGWLHLVLVAALVAVALLPPLKPIVGGSAGLLAAALVLGALAAGTYARLAPVRTFLTILSPAPLVFAALFLLDPSIGKLMQQGRSNSLADHGAGTETSVVMLIFDELPLTSLMNAELEIDARLFPNFARLAADSTWFRNATSNHSFTEHALPAILSGMRPGDMEDLPIAADHPDNLFAWFADSHRMNVWETFTGLWAPPEDEVRAPALRERMGPLLDDVLLVYAHIVLPGEMAAELPSVTTNWAGFGGGDLEQPATGEDPGSTAEVARGDTIRPAAVDGDFDDRTAVLRAFIESLDDSDEPTLSFLHTLFPHGAWERLPTGQRYPYRSAVPGHMLPGPFAHGWNDQEWVTAQAFQRHLLQLGHVDRLLGELLERLEAVGAYDRSLIVLLSDHGCTFQNKVHKRRGDESCIRDILHVPLFVKAPFQHEGRVLDRNVELIDVIPTMADALQVELPWEADGTSGFDTTGPERADKSIYRTRREMLTVPAALPTEWPALDRKLALFDGSAGWKGVYALAARPGIVGRALDELERAEPLDATVELSEDWAYDRVDTGSGILPAFVQGEIDAAPGTMLPAAIAVALNGRLYGVATPYDPGDEHASFGVIVPPSAFVDGRNTVEIFALLDGPRLAPIPGPLRLFYELREDDLVCSDGRVFELAPVRLRSRLDRASMGRGHLLLAGWAANMKTSTVGETLVVFADGGESVFDSPFNVVRSAHAEQFGEDAPTGFRYRIPQALLGGDPSGRLRIFVLSGREAIEVQYGEQGGWLRGE